MGTKRIQFFSILVLFMTSICLAEAGDMTMSANVKLKDGKGLMFKYGSDEIWIYPHEWDAGEYGRTLKIPRLAYGAGNFLSTDSEGALVFLSTAPYYGDITSVWDDDNGDVSALTAVSGDTLNASGADSTIPWKVNTTATPTTEGMAIWDSDNDYLAIGNGSGTSTVVMTGSDATLNDLTISTPSNIYSLDHDSFSGFDEDEHIDWTGATSSLLTTGTGTFENVHINSGETYDTILEANNSYNTADRTLTIFLNNADRSLGIYDSVQLYYSVTQDLSTTASPTFTGMTYNFSTQDYLLTNRANTYLAIQGQTSNASVAVDIFTKDGDAAAQEYVYLNLFGKGTPSDITNRELLTLAFYNVTDAQKACIYTAAAGTGTVRPIYIYTGANTDQFILGTDGNISMSGDLDVTGSVTTSGLTLDYSSQDFLFTSRGGATLAIQGQTEGQTAELELYTASGDGGDDICLSLYSMGSPSDLTDMELLKIGLDQSESYWQMVATESGDGTQYPIHIFTAANVGQLVLDTAGDVSMSGNLTLNDLTVGDSRYIGSASDTDAIQIEADGDVVLTQNLYIPTAFYHAGDGDTGMFLSDDSFYFNAGNVQFLKASETAFSDDLIINDGGVDINTRIEGVGQTHALFVQGSDGAVGIRDSAPAEALDVTGNINVTGVYKVGDDDGVSGTLELDDGTTEKITLVFKGGILTSRTVEATTGSTLADWTD